jgi:hypothetical protein
VAVRRAIQAKDIEAATEADREAAHEAAPGEAPAAVAANTREGEAVLFSGKDISMKSFHTV